MNVLVVGSGAVGSLLAAVLARGGASVSIVRRSLPAGPAVEEQIVLVAPGGAEVRATVGAVAGPERLDGAPDVAIVAVRAFDVEPAIATLPSSWPSTALLTIQNGVGAEETALARWPTGAVLAGSLTASVESAGEGRILWRRRGGIGLATVRAGGAAGLLAGLATSFERGGLPAQAYPDWRAMKWSKLVGNLVGNATSALLDRDPASIYADPRLFAVERAQLREALDVMARLGLRPVSLPGADVPLLALATRLPAPLARPILARVVGRARGGKSPSLRLHLQRGGGPSEAAWLNGAVARAGQRLAVATPVNAALARLMDDVAADPTLRAGLRADPDRLLAEVAPRPVARSLSSG